MHQCAKADMFYSRHGGGAERRGITALTFRKRTVSAAACSQDFWCFTFPMCDSTQLQGPANPARWMICQRFSRYLQLHFSYCSEQSINLVIFGSRSQRKIGQVLRWDFGLNNSSCSCLSSCASWCDLCAPLGQCGGAFGQVSLSSHWCGGVVLLPKVSDIMVLFSIPGPLKCVEVLLFWD